MRQRREVAGGADGTFRRDPRRHAGIHQANQRLDHAQADPGETAGQAINLQHHNQPRQVIVQRLANARRMGQHQRTLQVLQIFRRDPGLRQQAKTSVNAVGGPPFGKDGVDAGHALVNGGKRAAVEGNIHRVAVDVAELRQAELTRDQS
ncbi:hypothetical protein SB00610_03657 [Klebsiella quasipneumoniae subsp. similipneumoniae]|nr:hypothetical protein SB00610_03657 [Klebsiella quasipneumoniae subsp. similipneumoniae]